MKSPRQDIGWVLGFAIVFVATLDYYSWGKAEPLIGGMPYWVIYLFALNFILAGYYYFLAERRWEVD